MKEADLDLNLTAKRTRNREIRNEMERVVPWQALVGLIAPYAPEGKRGRPPIAVESKLRIHCLQPWFTKCHPTMEEALHNVLMIRDLAGLKWETRLADEAAVLCFRRLREHQKLALQILPLANR